MAAPLPIVFVPGLNCSARLYTHQLPALWRYGPVMVADHTRHDSMKGIGESILAAAPPHFALIGLSMGGYIAFELMRQAPERIARLALLDTGSRADTPEQTERRNKLIGLARTGRFNEVNDVLYPLMVHRSRHGDAALRQEIDAMAEEVGPDGFVRQQTALMHRPDSRPGFGAIRCPTLVLVGDADALTPPELSDEIAAGIAGAKRVTIPECGHMSTMEKPDAVNRALVEWMDA
jgi:pimeloyl-ACP methyl ester carboxylesterase